MPWLRWYPFRYIFYCSWGLIFCWLRRRGNSVDILTAPRCGGSYAYDVTMPSVSAIFILLTSQYLCDALDYLFLPGIWRLLPFYIYIRASVRLTFGTYVPITFQYSSFTSWADTSSSCIQGMYHHPLFIIHNHIFFSIYNSPSYEAPMFTWWQFTWPKYHYSIKTSSYIVKRYASGSPKIECDPL